MSQIYYSDSSVLVKRHIHEIGTDWLLELLDPAANNSIITSTLTIVEGLSALNRRVREAALDATDYPQIAEDFLVISNNEYRFVDVTAEVIDNTQRLLETYPLRAGDAIQLASAIISRTTIQSANLAAPIFLASDIKLLDAAIAEGFTTDNPLLHP
ncbi:MAG TPA: type II toxin-antitoxin system VapC family toxin [Pyrinomonadaceae bacterium]|nr:type II toxin-antitoxin system VapC family toxin [Chloracidobacterium sp.]MBP9934775.1 type II toxin-antitoxin system VapC family toxin [Pyrinomonadaceae bacterium]MBK7803194.1 type II toxin-antitoxin system VapC family toxin [Chloracidobacterium sp.]MBK9438160.1 type II toxin-antitoxin system VapC family toxin [Chloracidobacterium sp.]MBK9767558.1 type II toxin-antitoxin system VapC family toxin [Chloracidobacterium sp.]